jgi:hypothetical protein
LPPRDRYKLHFAFALKFDLILTQPLWDRGISKIRSMRRNNQIRKMKNSTIDQSFWAWGMEKKLSMPYAPSGKAAFDERK